MEEPFSRRRSQMAYGHGAASIGAGREGCWRLQDTTGTAGAWASAWRIFTGSSRSM